MNEITVKAIKVLGAPSGNPPTGFVYEWITVVDGAVVINTKQSDGTVGTVSGSQSAATPAPTTVTTSRAITSADNGALITNVGATTGVEFTLPSVASLGNKFEVTVANEVGAQNNGSKFVAVGGGTNSICYSSDGINWTPIASGAGTFSTYGRGVCWNGSKFVAVGEGTNSICYSSDGINWTGIASGAGTFSTQGIGVCWNSSNLYVDYWNGIRVTLTPSQTIPDQLPGTVSAGSSLKSSAEGDVIKLRTTDTGWICESAYPTAANWVDQL